MNQSINNTSYTCNVYILVQSINCTFQQVNVQVAVKGMVKNNVY